VLEPEELGQRKNDLAQALRDLRKQAGLTGGRLAARCGISQSKISKIETGKVLPSLADVERILGSLGVTGDMAEEISSLARLANTEFADLRSLSRKGLHYKQRELASFEANASHIRFFLPTMLTGLLHAPEYARASLATIPGDHSTAETFSGAVIMRDPRDVTYHLELFKTFESYAAPAEESRAILARVQSEFIS
jgi:transcriptional regulator with XRE-family HTH domain